METEIAAHVIATVIVRLSAVLMWGREDGRKPKTVIKKKPLAHMLTLWASINTKQRNVFLKV
jgi:hypothetical protein